LDGTAQAEAALELALHLAADAEGLAAHARVGAENMHIGQRAVGADDARSRRGPILRQTGSRVAPVVEDVQLPEGARAARVSQGERPGKTGGALVRVFLGAPAIA